MREEKTKRNTRLIYSANGLSSWGWSRPRPAVFHMDAGAQVLKPSSAALPGTFSGSWITLELILGRQDVKTLTSYLSVISVGFTEASLTCKSD